MCMGLTDNFSLTLSIFPISGEKFRLVYFSVNIFTASYGTVSLNMIFKLSILYIIDAFKNIKKFTKPQHIIKVWSL